MKRPILIALLAVALACPALAEEPVPTPPAAPGLHGSIAGRKLNRNVNFNDIRTVAPEPEWEPKTPAGCDAGPSKAAISKAVLHFYMELDTARSTPRVALAAQISRLNEIQLAFLPVVSSTPPCARDVASTAEMFMSMSIQGLTSFLGKNESGSAVFMAGSKVAFDRYTAERARLR